MGGGEERDKTIDIVPDIMHTHMTWGVWGGLCTRGKDLKGARERVQ